MLRLLTNLLRARSASVLSAAFAVSTFPMQQSVYYKPMSTSSSVAPSVTAASAIKRPATTTLTHIFVPEETNPSGNVHGGSILKHIEQAGWLAAARHCTITGSATLPPACATARLEHIDFHAPVFTGNLAEFQARVTFTSRRSMRVHVDVYAEDIVKGTRVLTNAASLWYVALDREAVEKPDVFPPKHEAHPGFIALEVPQLRPETPSQQAEFDEGRRLYEARSKTLSEKEVHEAHLAASTWLTSADPADIHTPAGSSVHLAQITLPSDCVNYNRSAPVSGGFIMKLMDNAAGMCAAKYCHTNVVTACIDTVDFLHAIRNGQLVYATARPTFSSSKSLEVEVLVEVEDILGRREPAAHAYFTFVSLDAKHKPQPVPALRLVTDDDKQRWAQGQARYDARRAERAAAVAKPASASVTKT